MKAIIVDDEKKSREVLAHFLQQFCPEVELAAMAKNVDEGIAAIEIHHPEVVFLDIEMPRKDGFELLDHFQPAPFEVVFVTAYESYAVRALRASAIDYLHKPISIPQLQEAVQRVKEKRASKIENGITASQYKLLMKNLEPSGGIEKLALPGADEMIFVRKSDILYLEAERAYTRVVTDKGVHTVAKPLRYFEEVLVEANFFRTHRSYVVNLDRVSRLVKREGGYLEMENGDAVKVSPPQRAALVSAFQGG